MNRLLHTGVGLSTIGLMGILLAPSNATAQPPVPPPQPPAPVAVLHTVDFENLTAGSSAGSYNRFDGGATTTTYSNNSRIESSPAFGSNVLVETQYPGGFAGTSKEQMIRIYFDELQDSVTLTVGYFNNLDQTVLVESFAEHGETTSGGPFTVDVSSGPQTVTVNKQPGGLLPELKIRFIEIRPVIPAGSLDVGDRIAVDDINFTTYRCPLADLDVNGDEVVDITDALIVFSMAYVNAISGAGIYYEPFDVDKNGVVDSNDVLPAWNIVFYGLPASCQ